MKQALATYGPVVLLLLVAGIYALILGFSRKKADTPKCLMFGVALGIFISVVTIAAAVLLSKY